MKQNEFPNGWDEKRILAVLKHYDTQSEEEVIAEDETAFETPGQTFMEIPIELVPEVRQLIAKFKVAACG